MGHEAVKMGKDGASDYKASLGMKMFWFYVFFYVLYTIVNVNWPSIMAKHMLGVNVAMLWGMGLIILAMVQALIYHYLCTKAEQEAEANDSKEAGV